MRLAAVLFAALILLGLVAALLPARARAADVPALLLPPTLGRPDRVWVSGRVLEEKHGFPPAALYLRNVGPHTLSGYKEPVLARLLARFPELPLLLVGDSGEKDPEIFAALAKDHPGRVLRAYVRKATPEPGPARRFEGLLLFADPAEVEADARGRGIVAGACPAP